MSMGWDYPPGLEHHPDAPWNQREPDEDEPAEPDDFTGNDDD